MIQFYILLSLVIGFVIVTYAIPRIIFISNQKKLFDVPNERSAAKVITPTLGGVGIFLGFYVSLIMTLNHFNIQHLTCLLLASLIMFMVGLKDDLIGLSARRKLLFQVLTALYLIYMGGIKITNLHGIMGINELDSLSSAALSLLMIVGLINAYNLIDGIDGLASGIGILISIVYGTLFVMAGRYDFAIVGFSLTGSLMAFFFYNVFGRANKIFMGDTGSLTLGVIFAFLTIRYLELPESSQPMIGSPAIALAILIVPIVDTLRVMTIRIIQKRSPFSPDMNHVHHQLLRLSRGIHLHASLTIIVVNLTFIIFATTFAAVADINLLFFSLLTAGFVVAYIPVLINKRIAASKMANERVKVIQMKSDNKEREQIAVDA